MTEPNPNSEPNAWRKELTGIRADVAEMAAARVELAQLELAIAVQSGKRWALAAGGFAIAAVAGTTLLFALGGEWLASRFGGSETLWKGSLALALLAMGLCGLAWLARRIRRTFRPLAQTIDELREDALWLREWLGSDSSPE